MQPDVLGWAGWKSMPGLRAPDGWMEHNPPLSFHLHGLGWANPILRRRVGERLFHPAQPQGHALHPEKDNFSDRFSIPSPARGPGPAKLKVSGALGDQAK